MITESDLRRLKDGVFYGREALAIVARSDRQAVFDQPEVKYALTHLVQIIGEACWKLSDDFKRQHPSVPWKAIAATRHRIVHDYENINYEVIWQVASQQLLPLVTLFESLIPPPNG